MQYREAVARLMSETFNRLIYISHCNTLQHTATHCNTLQHTATHCNTLQRTATHCHTLPHTATHCNALQRTYIQYREAVARLMSETFNRQIYEAGFVHCDPHPGLHIFVHVKTNTDTYTHPYFTYIYTCLYLQDETRILVNLYF